MTGPFGPTAIAVSPVSLQVPHFARGGTDWNPPTLDSEPLRFLSTLDGFPPATPGRIGTMLYSAQALFVAGLSKRMTPKARRRAMARETCGLAIPSSSAIAAIEIFKPRPVSKDASPSITEKTSQSVPEALRISRRSQRVSTWIDRPLDFAAPASPLSAGITG